MSNYISKLKSPYQEVFGTAPVDQKFIDQIGNNDVTYKNVQIARFTTGAAELGGPLYTNTPNVDITIWFRTDKVPINPTVGTIYSESFGGSQSHFRITTTPGGNINIFLYNQEGQALINNITGTGITTSINGEWHSVRWVDNNGNCEIWYDGILNKSFTYAITGNIIMNLSTVASLYFGSYINFYEIDVRRVLKNNSEYLFQDGDDDVIIDTGGNNHHGFIFNEVLLIARGTKIDGIDSVLINNGYTLFQQIADPTKYITAAYDNLGNPTLTSKLGYNKIAEIPPNVVSDNKITYDGILDIGQDADATFEDIDSVEIIPKEDFTINNSGDVIKDMASLKQ